jgi:heme exporter protein C
MATKPIASQQASVRAVAIPGLWWKLLTGLWIAAMTLAAFLYVGPAPLFPYPEGARAIFFHVPSAYVCILVLTVATWHAGKYVINVRSNAAKAAAADVRSAAFMESSLVFGVITLVSGMLFSQLQWGKYWSWDPRQTSMLVVCLILIAYVVLRAAVEEPDARARLSAVYALIAFIPTLFLLVALPRIVYTLHGDANQAVIGNKLAGGYRTVMYGMALPAFLALAVWTTDLRIRCAKILARRADTF